MTDAKPAVAIWHLELPWRAPPLGENQRLHWYPKARNTAKLRHDAGWLAREAKIPALVRCEVELHWAPATNRRRDAENPVPTLKALCDGLVDAGVVRDDTPRYMTKRMPIIEPVNPPGRMWLVVRDLDGAA